MGTSIGLQTSSETNNQMIQKKYRSQKQKHQQQPLNLAKRLNIEIAEPGQTIRFLEIQVPDSSLTCGWLLSEVIRRHQERAKTKLPIVTLKTKSNNEILDYMLLMFDRPIQPLADGEILQAVFAEYVENQQMMALFEPIKVIGKGGFSKVIQVRKKDSGRIYAMKIINKDFIIQEDKVNQIMSERRIIEKLNNPFIVKLRWAFQSRKDLHLVLDFCPGGELFFHLHNIGRLTEDQSRFYFSEILLGLEYIHNNNIIYRDLKPENILLDIDGHIKLTDFGLSKDNMPRSKRTNSFCGSPEYMSPEMLKGLGHSRSVDFYSLGALLYEMLTGLPPFYDRNREVMYHNIQNQEVKFPSYVSQSAKSLIAQLLIKEPEKRMGSLRGIQEIKDHPWCTPINWQQIALKKQLPPFRPNLRKSNFDIEYLQMPLDIDPESYLEHNNTYYTCFSGFEFQDEHEQKLSKALLERTPRMSTNKSQMGIGDASTAMSSFNSKLTHSNDIQSNERSEVQDPSEEDTANIVGVMQKFPSQENIDVNYCSSPEDMQSQIKNQQNLEILLLESKKQSKQSKTLQQDTYSQKQSNQLSTSSQKNEMESDDITKSDAQSFTMDYESKHDISDYQSEADYIPNKNK